MKIDAVLLKNLNSAVKNAGGIVRFAGMVHINPANISRYLNGKVRTISDDNWEKLRTFTESSASNLSGSSLPEETELNKLHKYISLKQIPLLKISDTESLELSPLALEPLSALPYGKLVVALTANSSVPLYRRLRSFSGGKDNELLLVSDDLAGPAELLRRESIIFLAAVRRRIIKL